MSAIPDNRYRRYIFCCINRRPQDHPRGCCGSKNSEALLMYMRERVQEIGLEDHMINISGCLDRCELGPVMVVFPDGVCYSPHAAGDVDEIIQQHLVGGKPVERLLIRPDQT